MPYPSRPVLEPLEEFKGSATVRQSPEQRARLIAFAAEQYVAGRSLRQIAELTDHHPYLNAIAEELNEMPMRCLGWLTPREAYERLLTSLSTALEN